VRTLETCTTPDGTLTPSTGYTGMFIYPGHNFQTVDGLITNFHLPESTLIMLVSALASRENILNAYNEAIEQKYRFFSFGDAMLIW
ncbi:MAG: S-adenosylmethionine:tRNA ribosyltransferase-isomerase, partial [Defluviitaleaceae bacterium]|nr:S-adenosylmethionine:tRNA ribosyltransferase-isomerase [Defluviitaleaceae bacterium]